jgi:hypothetical protein
MIDVSILSAISNGKNQYESACKKSLRRCLRHGGRNIDRWHDVRDCGATGECKTGICRSNR